MSFKTTTKEKCLKTDKILVPQTESLDKETVCFKVSAKSIDGKHFLVVPEGWEAVCISDGQLGKVLKRGKYKLSSLKGKSHLFEVLFYPTLSEFSFLWGTKEQMDFSDPIYSLPIKMGANGKLVFLIRNIRNLYLSSKQGQSLSVNEIKNQVVSPLIKFLQENIENQIKEQKLSFLEFEKNKDKVFKDLTAQITFFLQNEFGLKLSNFLVDGVIFDKKLFKTLEKEKLKEKVLEEEQQEIQKQENHLQNNLYFQNEIVQEIKQTQIAKQENDYFKQQEQAKELQTQIANATQESQHQAEQEEMLLL